MSNWILAISDSYAMEGSLIIYKYDDYEDALNMVKLDVLNMIDIDFIKEEIKEWATENDFEDYFKINDDGTHSFTHKVNASDLQDMIDSTQYRDGNEHNYMFKIEDLEDL